MPRERILITVKTYPTLSRKYGETVCTAGLRPNGSWVRIYPVPFRRLEEPEQYKKFDWVDVELVRNTSDHRPETFKVTNFEHLVPVGHMDTNDAWRERRSLLLNNSQVFTRMQDLIDDANSNVRSLAIFKPSKIYDFFDEPEEDRQWDAEKVAQMREQSKQVEMFEEDRWRETFRLIDKLPYAFSYSFEDSRGRRSNLQVLDWECGQLFWSCMRRNGGEEADAINKVRYKYFEEFCQRDLHFLMGTTQRFHGYAKNPWVIIGVFAPPYVNQGELDLGL